MRLFLIDRGIADQVDIENLTHCEFETDENRYYRVTSNDITHSQQGRNALDFVESVKSFWSYDDYDASNFNPDDTDINEDDYQGNMLSYFCHDVQVLTAVAK